ncbi:MAG: nicotinate-nucleotide--dimethylbenzimidazole phosphoribosyltransferase [Deltaproteobacteria bacterium]|jgi:nicotinate-nucleotide--dimethylbenzimidazole phosphoribosyltransferase|nr:nicotinate-nucleotide--dimethylbenzimidazole phosphoribosyltransferase [Deltaproteobacteria bacterium]
MNDVPATLLERTRAAIVPPDESVAAVTQHVLDFKTKPRGSLGRLEGLACRLAAMQGVAKPQLPTKAVVVMGADHGVAAEGVSAYPSEVTRQMLLNFAAGGAAINVLARQAGARLVVIDMGVLEPLPEACGVRAERVGAGTQSFVREPAMTEARALAALAVGIGVADELVDDGVGLIGLGEMGIGNTTSATALVAAFTGAAPDTITGRGTGIDDAGWLRKVDVVRRALALHGLALGAERSAPADPLRVLACLGGYEIAGLAGVALGAAARRVPVLLDGFISTAAGLVAARLAPLAAGYFVAAHRSVEVGHRVALEALGLRPLLDLDMRLGEGTGAALAMGIVDAALAILHDMATFESAGVADTGR